MSRKILKVAFAVLSLLIIAGMVIFIEKHKVKPKERAEMQSTEQMNSSIISEDLQSNLDGYLSSDGETSPIADDDKGTANNEITYGKLIFRPKSYEIVTSDDKLHESYNPEYFKNEEYPALSGDYEEEVVDYEAIRNEAPELDDLWDNKSDYTEEEAKEIEGRYADVIKSHTEIIRPGIRYLFVTLEVENTEDKPVYDSICLYAIGDNGDFTDYICYFDKTESLTVEEKSKNLTWYHYEPKEIIECTIGFALSESRFPEGTKLYIGRIPVGDVIFDPEKEGNIISLRSLNEVSN